MTLEDVYTNITTFFSSQDNILKTALVLIMLLFILFAIILTRQIGSLAELVDQISFTPVLKFIGYAIILTTVGLLLVTILV